MFYLLVVRWSDTDGAREGWLFRGLRLAWDKELASTSPHRCVLINQSISADTASF